MLDLLPTRRSAHFPRRPTWVALAVALLSGPLAPLHAQEVRGRVVSDRDGAPLAGALVSLLDDSGATLGMTVAAADGGFVFSDAGAAAGVRAEAPGWADAEAAVGAGGEGALVLRSRSGPPDASLPRLRADASCRISAEQAARVAALWGEATKALRAAQWFEASGAMTLESATWYRELEPRRLAVVEESRTPRPGFHPTARRPSPPAAELADAGYIRGGAPGESLAFHGPDPSTLADAVFAQTHCMGFEPEGPREDWVGLTFAPLDEQAREVEGTLWIDRATGAPERLEFRYTTLPWPVRTDKVGGGMDLEQLPGGAWIVSRWWLRMPRVGVREERVTQWAAPSRRYSLTGVVEEGGEITRIRHADGSVVVIAPPDA